MGSTQYLDEADQLADQIVVIDDGKVIAEGTPEKLKSKVGNDRLELVFENSKTLDKAVNALGKQVFDMSQKEFSLTVIVKDTNKDIRQALDTLAKDNVEISSITVHRPSLDDVFLSLTGKQKQAIKGKAK